MAYVTVNYIVCFEYSLYSSKCMTTDVLELTYLFSDWGPQQNPIKMDNIIVNLEIDRQNLLDPEVIFLSVFVLSECLI